MEKSLAALARDRELAYAEQLERKKKRGPGLTEDEAAAATRCDLRTAATVTFPSDHQLARHAHLYGPEEVGRCKALYDILRARGMSTPEKDSDAARGR
jgi:hypothetical protein